jgi:hypothetical protein
MNTYYSFSDNDIRGALHLKTINNVDGHEIFQNNLEGIELPIQLTKLQGKKPHDIISCGWACLYVISERVKQMLEMHEITGWTTFPVQISEGLITNSEYYGFSVIGKSGPIINEQSKLTKMPPRMPGGSEYEEYIGIHFDEATRNQVDFFTPKGTTMALTTERVKDLFYQEKITNCAFELTTELPNYAIKYG